MGEGCECVCGVCGRSEDMVCVCVGVRVWEGCECVCVGGVCVYVWEGCDVCVSVSMCKCELPLLLLTSPSSSM